MELNVQFTNDSKDMQFEQDDKEFKDFQNRKETIISNMSKMIEAKYPEEQYGKKHKELLRQVRESMDEEEDLFRRRTISIKTYQARLTVKKQLKSEQK